MTFNSSKYGVELALGQQQAYPDSYDPTLLQAIERNICRQHLPQKSFKGTDIWTAYELSWLDPNGKPVVAIAEFHIPASSPHIIESKSFKYYLNSFNQTRICREQLVDQLQQDLSTAAGQKVELKLHKLDEYQAAPYALAEFKCVDELSLDTPHYTPDASLLLAGDNASSQLCSHLLKSNCPVTGQPDWASIWVNMEGASLTPESFLAYIVSYRGHQDFHENCVEQIYCDLQQQLKPAELWVYARYTRRGGLDINPFRASSDIALPAIKGVRQ